MSSGTADAVSVAELMLPRARSWSERSDISARSALVTILGDTVAPLGGTVWLNDLITMAALFGFNERLVRTSMFRLVSERWVENERVGRRSRYSLTPFATREFTTADARIYRRREAAWNGVWTLVFAGPLDDSHDEFVRRLRWRGFAELTRDVYAAPAEETSGLHQLASQLGVACPPVATATFDDLAALTTMVPFRDSSGLAEADAAYRGFLHDYDCVRNMSLDALADQDAFVLRTMVVHDLRRLRLRDPELPRELLPPEWPGDAAMTLAGDTYHALEPGSWRYVQAVTGLEVDPDQPPLRDRFRND